MSGGTSKIFAYEGTTSISDDNGSLLFYTRGDTVWNKNHLLMSNGSGLLGNRSATQSSIAIPEPGNDSIYFLFTNGATDVGYCTLQNGFCYSIIDMSLSGGLGGVTMKNVKLLDSCVEKVTAVKHANCNDYWVITHGLNSNTFYSYKINNIGISAPVLTSLGSTLSAHAADVYQNAVGVIKASPNGKKIAIAYNKDGIVELFDFDNMTGMLSNPIQFLGVGSPYGISFSPDNSKLYIAAGTLLQYDMLAGNAAAIIASKTPVGSADYSIQLGPDHQLYIANYVSNYLSVMHFPNKKGAACNFEQDAVNLGSGECRLGLPNFMESYFQQPLTTDFSATTVCEGIQTTFSNNANVDPTYSPIWTWNFGDGNNSSGKNPYHVYDSAGTYNVKLLVTQGCYKDSLEKTVTVKAAPDALLDDQLSACAVDSLVLDAGNAGGTYFWSTGAMTQTIKVGQSGLYKVLVINALGCGRFDSVDVAFGTIPIAEAGNDTTISITSAITLNGGKDGMIYSWSPSATLSCSTCQYPVATPAETTTYRLIVSNAEGCSDTAFVTIYVDSSSDVFVPNSFSPNGDGNNDEIKVFGKGIKSINFSIYDRWGEKVFYTNDKDKGWDGTFKKRYMDTSVFQYYLFVEYYNGKQEKLKGNIVLVK